MSDQPSRDDLCLSNGGINIAWTSESATSADIEQFHAAWRSLVDEPEWEEWLRSNADAFVADSFLYLRVDDDRPEESGERFVRRRDGVDAYVSFRAMRAHDETRYWRSVILRIYRMRAEALGIELPDVRA